MEVYWLSQQLNCYIKKYIIDSWQSAEKKLNSVLMKMFFKNIAFISLKF